DPVGRVGILRQLALGLVAHTILVAVGAERVGRDEYAEGCIRIDGNAPAAFPGGGAIAEMAHFLAIFQAIVVAVGYGRVGAKLGFLQIGQAVVVGVAQDGRIRRSPGALFQLVAIGQAIAVGVRGGVVGVRPVFRAGEQPVAVGVGQRAEGRVPG